MTVSPFDHMAALAMRTADRHGPIFPMRTPTIWERVGITLADWGFAIMDRVVTRWWRV